ncbi:MAG: efflux RND transporter permease subunit [Gemmatimonadetes bacterium]|nr:efflux RND transporter permease subunit [Gemmatimonadota bacterium]
MSIPGTATRRPVAVAMLFLAVILLGGISYFRLPINLLPEVSYPRLVVYTSYPDVAPAEVERLVTETVEATAAAVPGVEKVSSVSRDGVSLVTLRFAWGTDMDFAMLNTRERLDNIRDALPETADRPRILRVDPESEPIMVLSVTGGSDLWETKDLAETVFRRRLEQLDGVAQAAVTGGLDREIQVEVRPQLLEAYGIDMGQIASALAAANYSAPGGTVLQGRYRYPLRTLGEFQTVDEIRDVVVARQEQGGGAEGESTFRLVRLRDVADVVDGFAEREAIARYNGVESVGLLVFKEAGANTVAVAKLVEETLVQLREEFTGIQMEVASSQAGFISDSISNVVQALIFGGVLAFLVLFLFLRDPRYPVAIALAIPISVMGTFALMDAAGVSLNIMSLGGLALGVGMLVDNSIVVLENVFRHRELGARAAIAATLGAEEVQGAITASTLTTISVFGPIIYVQGVAGELFRDLSLAVAFSLLTSLLVALILLPPMAARFALGSDEVAAPPARTVKSRPVGFWRLAVWLGTGLVRLPFRMLGGLGLLAKDLVVFWGRGIGRLLGRVFGPPLRAFDTWFERFAARYHRVLEWSLDHRARVVLVAFVALVLSGAAGLTLDRDLLPDVDQGAFDARLELAQGTGLLATADVAAEIEAALLADPGVDVVFSRIGRDVRSYAETEDVSGLNTADFQVRLVDGASTSEVLERLRPLARTVPDGLLTFDVGQATALGQVLGGTDADVAVRIQGEDLKLAYARAELVRERLEDIDVLGNVRIGVEEGQPQIHVQVDREAAARFGVEPRQIADELNRAMRGDLATEFVDFDRKIDIVVRFPNDMRFSLSTLNSIRVQGVPLRELIDVHEVLAPSEIFREDQGRVITVYADVVSGGLDQAITVIGASLADLPATRELRMNVGGENEEMRRSFRDLSFAFGLALILVYMILAAQFESFVHPFTILMAVPLALIGAVVALVLTGQGINTMSLIGIVILVGIVVNDSIVKVDFINQSRARGMGCREAILEAGRVRLRPIIMTTVTTVLGLSPMALGIGRGADLRAPLAIAVIGGLIVATMLTLIVVPVVYSLIEGLRFGTPAESGEPVSSQPVPVQAT